MALFSEQGVTTAQVIDGITGVTTSSKFDFQDYADAMANAGGAAAGIGVDFEDLNTLLSGLPNRRNLQSMFVPILE